MMGRVRARFRVTRWAAVALMAAVALAGAPAAGASGRAPVVRVARVAGLGPVLVSGSGLTLYAYEPDHARRTTCLGYCARLWPPLLLPAGARQPVGGAGVERRLLGILRRPDGALQVTYAGWPLYRWQGDQQPGQALGQADEMGLWDAVGPAGHPVVG